jgi:hypothetical protein
MGEFFSSKSELLCFAKNAIEERRYGAEAIGIFPSPDHTNDMLVIKDVPIESPRVWHSPEGGSRVLDTINDVKTCHTHIIRLPMKVVQEGHPNLNKEVLKVMRRRTIWVWKKPEA